MSFTRTFTKLGAMFRKKEIDRELDDEIRSHLAMEVEENLENGMNPDEARHAANRAFGDGSLHTTVVGRPVGF